MTEIENDFEYKSMPPKETIPMRYFISPSPNPKSALNMGGGLWWQFEEPRPNIWFRFWQFLFLGFVWKKV